MAHVNAILEQNFAAAALPVQIEICTNQAQWDAYVMRTPESSSYHRWIWGDIVTQTYGHEFYRLMATRDGVACGVLPLGFIKSRIFGKCLSSMPFSSYGGVIADDPAVADQLLSAAIDLARKLKATHIELRQGSEIPTSWLCRTPKVTMEVPLPANTDELWSRLSSGMRNKVRNAKKNGLRVEWSGGEAVKTFYKVFATNMRNLGSPVYPRAWFENVAASLPKEARFITVWDGRNAVASGLTTSFRDAVELPLSGSLPESRKKYSAVLMYWSVLEWAVQNGYRRADLGRCTPGAGTYEFKRHFGCIETPLHWYYWLAPGTSVPETRPDNPRFRLATRIWQHLPVAVANQVGPQIVRSIP